VHLTQALTGTNLAAREAGAGRRRSPCERRVRGRLGSGVQRHVRRRTRIAASGRGAWRI